MENFNKIEEKQTQQLWIAARRKAMQAKSNIVSIRLTTNDVDKTQTPLLHYLLHLQIQYIPNSRASVIYWRCSNSYSCVVGDDGDVRQVCFSYCTSYIYLHYDPQSGTVCFWSRSNSYTTRMSLSNFGTSPTSRSSSSAAAISSSIVVWSRDTKSGCHCFHQRKFARWHTVDWGYEGNCPSCGTTKGALSPHYLTDKEDASESFSSCGVCIMRKMLVLSLQIASISAWWPDFTGEQQEIEWGVVIIAILTGAKQKQGAVQGWPISNDMRWLLCMELCVALSRRMMVILIATVSWFDRLVWTSAGSGRLLADLMNNHKSDWP